MSLDTFCASAVERWCRHAEPIGFPFDVATNPGTFHRVADNHTEDRLLVDTAGRGVGEQRSTLAGYVGGLRDMPSGVLLALPARLHARDADCVIASHAVRKVTGVTKLVETDQVGGVTHAPLARELPVTCLCDGARVPEDIHDAAVDKSLDAIFPEQA